MRIAPESRPFQAMALAAMPLVWWLAGPAWVVLPALVYLFVLFFFRDPVRPVPGGADLVLSPADGRVVHLVSVTDPIFQGGSAWRISIFLSLFDVHVNRVPQSGVVRRIRYSKGRFRAAFKGKASLENEQNRLDIETDEGPISVTQIAGAVARRIVCDVSEGETVTRGERFGLIRFGSRVDVLLPAGAHLMVGVGERVRATASVLARLPARGEGSPSPEAGRALRS
ncbi:MAG: phosphatidylserine decarboxylase family protein [Acidobacteriota bacterium]